MDPRMRVISDNDYSGDPDGLFQLAHHLLSPSVDVRAVIGSHLRPGDWNDPSDQTAENAKREAERVVDLLGLAGQVLTLAGSNVALSDAHTPIRSAAALAIVEEAMTDSDLPLYVTCGAGLTELASAYLIEPRIAERLTVVWIGGPEYPGHAVAPPHPDGPEVSEYNTRIDITAARVIFDSTLPLWQVPRNVYRQAIYSFAELDQHIRPSGPIGAHLAESLDRVVEKARTVGMHLGEAYILGDSPLVLLTALQSPYQPDPSSSRYVVVPAPRLDADGRYVERHDGRSIRVYTDIDNRLMFGDLVGKLRRASVGAGR
jgi:inosine-uridine nucleoside N-ribohydrolase